jgi:hypothetical protein
VLHTDVCLVMDRPPQAGVPGQWPDVGAETLHVSEVVQNQEKNSVEKRKPKVT